MSNATYPENAKTNLNAILMDLSDGEARSAKQLYERIDTLVDRQAANLGLCHLKDRALVNSAPVPPDWDDKGAKLVWTITDAGRAYLAGSHSDIDHSTDDTDGPDETPPEAPALKAKPKAKPAAKAVTVPAQAGHVCQCGGACGRNASAPSGAKYLRDVQLVDGRVDVYAVLVAFGVTCPARQHAIKKLLCAGLRGKGDESQDLSEARDAVERAIQIQRAR